MVEIIFHTTQCLEGRDYVIKAEGAAIFYEG